MTWDEILYKLSPFFFRLFLMFAEADLCGTGWALATGCQIAGNFSFVFIFFFSVARRLCAPSGLTFSTVVNSKAFCSLICNQELWDEVFCNSGSTVLGVLKA